MTRPGKRSIHGCIHQTTIKECTVNNVNTRNKLNSSAVFNLSPCISLHKDVISQYSNSLMHKSAVTLGQEHLAAEQGGGIVLVFSVVASVERKAPVGAMKCLYGQQKMK